MTLDEIPGVLLAAQNVGRTPSLIRIGLGVYRDWRRAMDQRFTFQAPASAPAEQRIYGVPFVVDATLPPGSVEFVGI